MKNISFKKNYQNIRRTFLKSEKLENSGKLQIINGKFQNNVINNVKQISSNSVIILTLGGIIFRGYYFWVYFEKVN